MTLVCPVCTASHPEQERFCGECGVPLVDTDGVPPRNSDAAMRARKVRPGYAEGPLVRVASARHQAEAEMIAGLLLEEGIPSVTKRTGGFDVPDFLAAGPRDVLVAASGVEAAREILGDRRGEQRLPPPRHPAWVRALAVTLAIVVVTVFAAGIAVPFFH